MIVELFNLTSTEKEKVKQSHRSVFCNEVSKKKKASLLPLLFAP